MPPPPWQTRDDEGGEAAVLARQCLRAQVIDVPVMGGTSNLDIAWTVAGRCPLTAC